MKALLALLLSAPIPALATVPSERYTEQCWVFKKASTCMVVDTRTHNGFLDTRTIYNSEYSYTFKQVWVQGKGFMSWDSVTKKQYKYSYKMPHDTLSQVSPHLKIKNVSWD